MPEMAVVVGKGGRVGEWELDFACAKQPVQASCVLKFKLRAIVGNHKINKTI